MRDFLDIEAMDSESEGEEMEEESERKWIFTVFWNLAVLISEARNGWTDYDSYLRDARSEAWECGSSDEDTDDDAGKMTISICVNYRIDHKPAYIDWKKGEDTRAGREQAWAGQIAESSDNDNAPRDHRMTAVINRYESTASGVESQAVNVVENEEIAGLAERLMRMPTANDPGLWKVRVWVSRLYYVSE